MSLTLQPLRLDAAVQGSGKWHGVVGTQRNVWLTRALTAVGPYSALESPGSRSHLVGMVSYRVIPDGPDGFAVEIAFPSGATQVTACFATIEAADAWISDRVVEIATQRCQHAEAHRVCLTPARCRAQFGSILPVQ